MPSDIVEVFIILGVLTAPAWIAAMQLRRIAKALEERNKGQGPQGRS
jgi:hypothetical protein